MLTYTFLSHSVSHDTASFGGVADLLETLPFPTTARLISVYVSPSK